MGQILIPEGMTRAWPVRDALFLGMPVQNRSFTCVLMMWHICSKHFCWRFAFIGLVAEIACMGTVMLVLTTGINNATHQTKACSVLSSPQGEDKVEVFR
eukprot:1161625-Pelagomonas_calceolata.AAC.24